MFLTHRHGKTLQFPMGLVSAYLWVLETRRRTEQSLEPFSRSRASQHGELMRSSLPWGTEQYPQQQQLPQETGRGKLTVHSITLCSVPSNLREGQNAPRISIFDILLPELE